MSCPAGDVLRRAAIAAKVRNFWPSIAGGRTEPLPSTKPAPKRQLRATTGALFVAGKITTFAGVAGTLLLLLVSTVAIDSGNGKQSEPDVSSIAAMEPVFQGFRTIQANKDIHRSVLTDMTVKGQLLRHELDSMIAIPVKSREDSLRIILKYRQLENIVKSIKNNDNP